MKIFDAIIFDMDGLLLDTERLTFEAFQATCSNFNLGDLSCIYKRCIGTNYQKGSSILQAGLEGLADFEDFSAAWEEAYRTVTKDHPIPLKEGAEELLHYVKAIGTPMAIATSSALKNATAKLQSAGILHYFDQIVGGDQVVESKPDPEIFLKAALALLSEPAKCLALEDSKNGVKAALAAGMTVIQIPDLVLPDEELLELDYIVLKSLTDIMNYEFSPLLPPSNM